MPLYRITAPNGLTYEIEGPDGASDADVAQAVMAQHPEAGQPRKESGILSELRRGIEQPISSAVTGLKSVFGTPEEKLLRASSAAKLSPSGLVKAPPLKLSRKPTNVGSCLRQVKFSLKSPKPWQAKLARSEVLWPVPVWALWQVLRLAP